MNDLYLNNSNYPPGHDDRGIKIKCSGPAISGNDTDKMFKEKMKSYPTSIDQADKWLNCMRKFGDVINELAIERMKREGLIY